MASFLQKIKPTINSDNQLSINELSSTQELIRLQVGQLQSMLIKQKKELANIQEAELNTGI